MKDTRGHGDQLEEHWKRGVFDKQLGDAAVPYTRALYRFPEWCRLAIKTYDESVLAEEIGRRLDDLDALARKAETQWR